LEGVGVESGQVELALAPPQEVENVVPGPVARVGRQVGRQLRFHVQVELLEGRAGELVLLLLGPGGEGHGVAPQHVWREGQRQGDAVHHSCRGQLKTRRRQYFHLQTQQKHATLVSDGKKC